MPSNYRTIYRVRTRAEAVRLAEMARQSQPHKSHVIRKVGGAYSVMESEDRRSKVFWDIGRGGS